MQNASSIGHVRFVRFAPGDFVNIAMIGTGYVGLVSGACFAEFGSTVTCVDLNANKIERLRNGEISIYEPGLDDLVAKGQKSGRLRFTTDLAGAVAEADAVFLAVGTPSRRGDGHADLRYVEAAAFEVAKALTGYTVIVTKSTVPVARGVGWPSWCAKAIRRPRSTWRAIRSFCARARPSATSCVPTGW